MKLLLLVLSLLTGCATNQRVNRPATAPQMSEDQARQIGKKFAKAQGWQVKHMWDGITYVPRIGEWEMMFDVVGRGCPNVVYVNDETGATRFERGSP